MIDLFYVDLNDFCFMFSHLFLVFFVKLLAICYMNYDCYEDEYDYDYEEDYHDAMYYVF